MAARKLRHYDWGSRRILAKSHTQQSNFTFCTQAGIGRPRQYKKQTRDKRTMVDPVKKNLKRGKRKRGAASSAVAVIGASGEPELATSQAAAQHDTAVDNPQTDAAASVLQEAADAQDTTQQQPKKKEVEAGKSARLKGLAPEFLLSTSVLRLLGTLVYGPKT
ncbi:hypothetical protein WJX79_009789 [Trebouxia sp. C0005]